jgi:alkylhydroperoxidase/carboxymuconolactone decarboxylase family protein YurZ
MSLCEKDRRLVRLFAACVLGRFEEVARLRQSAPPGEPDRAWRETLLQVHVFAGFPRLVEAYGVLASEGGLGRLEPEEVLGESDQHARGRALFERIYQRDSEKIRAMLLAGHPDFANWIEGHAYGRILARPGLEPWQRELLACAALAVLGQERQLASHVRGAIRCGATPERVREAIEAVADLAERERAESARTIAAHFSSRDGGA